MTEQISSFTPHYSDQREKLFTGQLQYAEIQLLCISQQADTVGEKSKYKKGQQSQH